MRSRYRQRSKARWLIRGLAVFATLAIVAWQYGILPTVQFERYIHQPQPPSSSGDPSADAGKVKALDDGNAVDSEIDPIVFTEQTEPPVDDVSLAQAASQQAANIVESSPPSAADEWYDLTTPDMPARPPDVAAAEDGLSHHGAQPQALENAEFNGQQADGGSEIELASQQAPPEIDAAASRETGEPRFQLIDRQIQAGNYIEAHRELSTIYWNEPQLRKAIRGRIEKIARSIYFSPQPHYMEPYVVSPGDQLRRVAERYNVAWQYLARLNQIDPLRIRPGQRLKVIKGPFSAVVDLTDFELTVHAHGYYVRSYAIGIGKEDSTPLGTFAVVDKVVNPQYTDPDGKVVSADDPHNPLGERWIDLGSSYGIHGTIDPQSIGRAESRGCIRMRNADVEEVFDMLTVGSQVVIQR